MVAIELKTDAFFDRATVKALVDRQTRRALGQAGAIVRRYARSSIRKARPNERPSKPGKPPKSRSPRHELRTILFAYQEQTRSVVIGPMKFPGTSPGTPVPALLEFGGVGLPGSRGRRRRFEPRPYMAPAFEKARPKILEAWRSKGLPRVGGI